MILQITKIYEVAIAKKPFFTLFWMDWVWILEKLFTSKYFVRANEFLITKL